MSLQDKLDAARHRLNLAKARNQLLQDDQVFQGLIAELRLISDATGWQLTHREQTPHEQGHKQGIIHLFEILDRLVGDRAVEIAQGAIDKLEKEMATAAGEREQ